MNMNYIYRPLCFLLFLLFLFAEIFPVPLPGAEEISMESVAPDKFLRLESTLLSLDAAHSQAKALGGVKIFYKGISLEAEEVLLDLEKKESHAKGRIRLLHDGDLLQCESLSFHWEKETGAIQQGRLLIKDTGYQIQAEYMEKTGPDRYHLEQGSFSTCLCPSDTGILPWEVRAHEAEVELGGYAKVKKASFFLFGVPAFYSPVAYLPVKLHRETGFLIPRVDLSGNNGFEFGLPFYWAINASLDTTLTLDILTKRGVKPSLEFRYRPSKDTKGQWTLNLIDDQKTSDTGEYKDGKVRYSLVAEHTQQFADDFYDKMTLNIVSDNAYPEDFPHEVGSPSDRLLASRGIIGFRKGDFHAALEASYADLREEALPGQPTILGAAYEGFAAMAVDREVPQILPAMYFDFICRPIGPSWLSLGWGSSLVHFINEEGEERVREHLFPQGAVFFKPMPGVSFQSRWGIREIVSIGVDDGFGNTGTRHRTLLDSQSEIEASLSRSYLSDSYKFLHLIRPRLQYQWIEKLASDLFPVAMDGLDQLEQRNWLTYSLTSRLWGKKQKSGRPEQSSLLAEFYIAQSVDLERAQDYSLTQRLCSDLHVTLFFQPFPWFSYDLDLKINPYHDHAVIRSLETETSIWDKKKRYGFHIGYLEHRSFTVEPVTRIELWDVYSGYYDFDGIEKTLRTRLQANLSSQWSISLDTHYLVEHTGKIQNYLSLSYDSKCNKCWSIMLRLHQTVRPDDIGCSVRFSLEGLG